MKKSNCWVLISIGVGWLILFGMLYLERNCFLCDNPNTPYEARQRHLQKTSPGEVVFALLPGMILVVIGLIKLNYSKTEQEYTITKKKIKHGAK